MSIEAWILKQATQSNDNTASLWETFQPHRTRVTNLLQQLHRRVFLPDDVSPPWAPHGTLCLLGAGNSNDVDLRKLLRLFATIELVDIDRSALSRSIARLHPAEQERMVIHGGVNLLGLSGGAAFVVEGRNGVCSTSTISEFERGDVAASLRSLFGRRCDVVGATALFAMLVQQVQRHLNIPDSMPLEQRAREHGWDEVLKALSRSYLRGLAAAVRPGGAVAHVSTLVYKSGVLPNATYTEEQMWEEHVSRGDFFPETNPYAWLDAAADGMLHSAELWGGEMPYWVWRSSVVYATTWRAKAEI